MTELLEIARVVHVSDTIDSGPAKIFSVGTFLYLCVGAFPDCALQHKFLRVLG